MSFEHPHTQAQYDGVLSFWFDTLTPADWFRKSDALDERIRTRFAATHTRARQGELYHWRRNPEGRLAEIIVLDQWSRNMFRDTPQAFAQDAQALILAQEAVLAAADQKLDSPQRAFLYMPFMHSESAAIHTWALQLFSQPGLDKQLYYEKKHKAIIDRFGRYPHRNAVLGRVSSDAESAFLQQPGSSF